MCVRICGHRARSGILARASAGNGCSGGRVDEAATRRYTDWCAFVEYGQVGSATEEVQMGRRNALVPTFFTTLDRIRGRSRFAAGLMLSAWACMGHVPIARGSVPCGRR